MSKIKVLYKHDWEVADICSECGEYLSSRVTDSHWGSPCPRCGAVCHYTVPTIKTSRRFCVTYKPPFWKFWGKERGFYEWSGKTIEGKALSGVHVEGRIILNTPMKIAAAGVASGLF